MRSCLIMGSGRSGTSMLAGVLSRSDYYMGASIWPASEANPKGFFEDLEVNYVNELLLAGVTPSRPPGPLRSFYRSRPVLWQRWLSTVPVGTSIPGSADVEDRIRREVVNTPFCLKDPRFCYTVPAWRPFIGDAAFLCIFRSPTETATSILKDCRQAPYLKGLRVSRQRALATWTAMYRHVLDLHRREGDWLFIHYEQVLDGSAAPGVERLLGVTGDWDFPDAKLRRSAPSGQVTAEARSTYDELCQLAGFSAANSSAGRLR